MPAAAFPRTTYIASGRTPQPAKEYIQREQRHVECPLTMARWKSGLLPFVVLAIRVNWDTQRTSPSISLILFFHIAPLLSEKTRRESLRKKAEVNICVEPNELKELHTSFYTKTQRQTGCRLLYRFQIRTNGSIIASLVGGQMKRQTDTNTDEDHETS